MTKVTFISKSGESRQIDAPAGISVADAALSGDVPGIEADCGGFCACATCHVYLEGDWAQRVPPAEELEAAMLNFAFDVRPNSRLGCQIKLAPGLDGIVVRIPERQY